MLTLLLAESVLAATSEPAGAELNPVTFHGINFPGDLTIWTAVVFVVVLVILWKFAWGPLASGLEKREKRIADQIADAERANEEARRLLAEHEKRLAAAGEEVRAILADGQRLAERLGKEMLERAKAEAADQRQRALVEIDAAADAALKELAGRSATLAVELAGKIVRKKLDPQEHSRLIQDAVAGFAGDKVTRRP
jgi:F-type H+-transporting ATPase subunit b